MFVLFKFIIKDFNSPICHFLRYSSTGSLKRTCITISKLLCYLILPLFSLCSCANAASAKSFSAVCWRTCVSDLTCVICSSRVSKLPLQRTRQPRHPIPSGATVTRQRSSTSRFSHSDDNRRLAYASHDDNKDRDSNNSVNDCCVY